MTVPIYKPFTQKAIDDSMEQNPPKDTFSSNSSLEENKNIESTNKYCQYTPIPLHHDDRYKISLSSDGEIHRDADMGTGEEHNVATNEIEVQNRNESAFSSSETESDLEISSLNNNKVLSSSDDDDDENNILYGSDVYLKQNVVHPSYSNTDMVVYEGMDSGLVKLDPEIHKMSPSEQESIEEGVFKWNINNWASIESYTKVYSPVFEMGSEKWRLLMFPNGNNNSSSLSLYLENVTNMDSNESWKCCAQFSIGLYYPLNYKIYFIRESKHRFNSKESDWGFTHFIKFSEISHYNPLTHTTSESTYTPSASDIMQLKGNHSSLSKLSLIHYSEISNEDESADGVLTLMVYVRVVKDVTGNLWRDFSDYDSRKEIGYVGLKNQGATCYMNSLLQSLFFVDYFRRAVYQIPTDKEEDSKISVPLALQKLFYALQTSSGPVSTTELTKSFGWDSYESFLQRDAQEFSRKLMESLETKMKGTSAEGAIDKLFMGETKRFVKCIHVDYESSRVETFYDIPLNVKGCKNLADSFRQFIEPELLEGENRLNTEEFGLQVANLGSIFTKYPPVFHMQLKRFEYDMMRDMTVKINDRYEFPIEIDLGTYMHETAEDKNSQIYHLYGVLVHSGDVGGGHYYAFLRDRKTDKWIKFDDDKVIYVTPKEAIDDNFGGEFDYQGPMTRSKEATGKIAKSTLKKFTNAYMLVYIRDSDLNTILDPLLEEHIPRYLVDLCHREKREEDRKIFEKQQSQHFINVHVVTDDIIREAIDSAELIDAVFENCPTIKMKKSNTLESIREFIFEHYHIPVETQRFWTVGYPPIGTSFPRTRKPLLPIPEKYMSSTIKDLHATQSEKSTELHLYLEIGTPEMPLGPIQKNKCLLFVKYYDPSKCQLVALNHIYEDCTKNLLELEQEFKKVTELESSTATTTTVRFTYYQQTNRYSLTLLNPVKSLADLKLTSGDIVIFQPILKETSNIEYPTAVDYFQYLENRIVVTFKTKPINTEGHQGALKLKHASETTTTTTTITITENNEFKLELSKTSTYQQMNALAAEKLSLDPLHIRFTTYDAVSSGPKPNSIKYMPDLLVSEMVPKYYYLNPPDIIYYKILEESIVDLESKKSIKIYYSPLNHSEELTVNILVDFNATFEDIIDPLKKKFIWKSIIEDYPTVETEMRKFRMVEISQSNVIVNEYTIGDSISSISEFSTVYFERISDEELDSEKLGDKVIQVFHFYKELRRTHSRPFKFVLKRDETFDITKKRLSAKAGINEKEISKCRFALYSQGKGLTYLSDIFKSSERNSSLSPTIKVTDEDAESRPSSPSNTSVYTRDRPLSSNKQFDEWILYNLNWGSDDYLGLDHLDKSVKTGQAGLFEKDMKIQ